MYSMHDLVKSLKLPSSLSLRPGARSVFHQYHHLAVTFVPFVGLKDIIAHIETHTKFTQQGLNDNRQSLSLLNTGMSLMRKALLQKRMSLDIITASKGGTCVCVIIQTECLYVCT